MNVVKRINRPKCECGRAVVAGSVFCVCCRAAVKRKNVIILSRDKVLVFKKR